jgi:hypothetical protein
MDDAYRRERMGDKLADVTDPQSDRALAWWGKKPNSPLHCLRRDDCECEIEVESVNPPDETHSPTQIFTYIPCRLSVFVSHIRNSLRRPHRFHSRPPLKRKYG